MIKEVIKKINLENCKMINSYYGFRKDGLVYQLKQPKYKYYWIAEKYFYNEPNEFIFYNKNGHDTIGEAIRNVAIHYSVYQAKNPSDLIEYLMRNIIHVKKVCIE